MKQRMHVVIAGLLVGVLIGSGAAAERESGRRARRHRSGADRGEAAAAVAERSSTASAGQPAGESQATARPDSADSRWAEVLKRFDKDGDGKLNDEEREAARAAWQGRGGEGGEAMRRELLQRFDKDGGGQLNEQEREAARAAWQAQAGERARMLRGELVRRFDKDGDGKLNDEERKAAWEEFHKRDGPRAEEFRARIIQRFDKDGDGKLNDEERAAAEAAMREMRERGGRHGEGRNAPDAAPAETQKVGPTI